MSNFDVIVVGAGPGGLLAAGRAAELGGKVLILEKMRQEGRKLLLTGRVAKYLRLKHQTIYTRAQMKRFLQQNQIRSEDLENQLMKFILKRITSLIFSLQQ